MIKNDLLIQLKGYKLIEGKETSDGVFQMGYYIYADYVDKVFDTIIGDQIVQNYLELYEKIKDKPIKDLSLDEICVYCTFIRRGERFCDGHIAKFLDNGILVKLYERYLELC